MNDLQFKQLVGIENLTLAWRRVSTATNHAYKRYFRRLFYTYELAAETNVRDLHNRLIGGSYSPTAPSRVFLPKSSGLQRSITLLAVEDQIVSQALANAFSLKIRQRRLKLEGHCVFSNQLNADPNGIFFLKDWRVGYRAYLDRVAELFNKGNRWVAQFDLAAFYDTISHELLFRTAFPRLRQTTGKATIAGWLQTWANPRQTWPIQHGIAQGPQSSDFLAEVFLLPVDERMSKKHHYVRYVDDIRLFGKSELEVQAAVRELEALCRDRGLIPQGKKFAITQAASVQEALGSLPSIRPSGDPAESGTSLSAKVAERIFIKALGCRPRRVLDKSRARFVLFRAPPSLRLRNVVLKLMPRHPEHIEAFVYYLRQFRRSRRLIQECSSHIKTTPYEFVRGELFQLLAPLVQRAECKNLLDDALSLAKNGDAGISAKWGALVFLCRAEEFGLGKYSRFVLGQPALVQALCMASLPERTLLSADAVGRFLARRAVEPGLAFADEMIRRHLTLTTLGVNADAVPTQVRNVLYELGVIPGRPTGVDPMAEILSRRYGIPREPVWRALFGTEYLHGLQQLTQAEKLFDMGRSQWLNYQNSFNHAAFLALQTHLHALGLPGACKVKDSAGKLVKFGNLVSAAQPFGRVYPAIAGPFCNANNRRNKLDSSHPYDEKTGIRNRPLKRREQTSLAGQLAGAYAEIIQICRAHGIR